MYLFNLKYIFIYLILSPHIGSSLLVVNFVVYLPSLSTFYTQEKPLAMDILCCHFEIQYIVQCKLALFSTCWQVLLT